MKEALKTAAMLIAVIGIAIGVGATMHNLSSMLVMTTGMLVVGASVALAGQPKGIPLGGATVLSPVARLQCPLHCYYRCETQSGQKRCWCDCPWGQRKRD
jgi:hypothetical protein